MTQSLEVDNSPKTYELSFIAQLMINEEYAKKVIPFFSEHLDYFEDKYLQLIVKKIIEYYKKNDHPPSKELLILNFNGLGDEAVTQARTVLGPLTDRVEPDVDALLDLTEKWCHGVGIDKVFKSIYIENAATNKEIPIEEINRQITEVNNISFRKDKSVWAKAKSSTEFLDEKFSLLEPIIENILFPGMVTMFSSPKNIGKTHVAHSIAIALATGGTFLGKKVEKKRILILDRDNVELSILQERLKNWELEKAGDNLKILDRREAPDLKDIKAWKDFPIDDYDVLIIDSVGSSTEGVDSQSAKEITQIIATLLDLSVRGLCILLLCNTVKTGKSFKGRGEWVDRLGAFYEVRDATGWKPKSSSWWQDLPSDGAEDWADTVTRRSGKPDIRLAFIINKFRGGTWPKPICLEIKLSSKPYSIVDVTSLLSHDNQIENQIEQAKKISDNAPRLAQLSIEKEEESPVIECIKESKPPLSAITNEPVVYKIKPYKSWL